MSFPHLSLEKVNEPWFEELREAAWRVISSGRYVGGDEVVSFENAVARMCGTPYAVGVGNGLDALRLILLGYVEMGRLSHGDEVLVPANTYIASFLAISQAGLVPVPVDPDYFTMNITGSGVRKCVSARTKAVMPVHLYGRIAWDDELMQLVRDRNMIVVEDCAQALGARWDRVSLYGSCAAGGLGDASGISFYPTKNLGALGDGGMVVTHNEELAAIVRALANYGSCKRYRNVYMGVNSRLDPIQAAMLAVKLKYLAEVNSKRNELARVYDGAIDSPLVVKPLAPRNKECVWHQYVIKVPECRDELKRYLREHGVGTDVHYPYPPHQQPCYQGLSHGELPIAEKLAGEVLSLPIGQYLGTEQVEFIAEVINQFGK